MPYCTQADLESRYGENELIQLTDDDGAGSIDATKVADAIARADADIDGALSDAGYTPPVTWSRLRARAEALTRAFLYRYGRPEDVTKDFDEARAFLDKISAGQIKVPGYAAGESASVGSPDFEAETRVWDRDSLEDF